MRVAFSATILLYLVSLQWLANAAQAEPPEFKRTLDTLASAIKKEDFKLVGVSPSFIHNHEHFGEASPLASSPHGLHFAEVVQAGLLRRRGSDFEIVDTDVLLTALADAGITGVRDLDKLKELPERIDGLDALVVGGFEQNQGYLKSDYHLVCKLIDVRTGVLKELTSTDRSVLLADAIYEGRSIEVMRWTNAGLLPIGFIQLFALDLKTTFPLSPRSAETYFNFYQPHPLLNPYCPYDCTIRVDNKPRDFVVHERLDDVYVALEPGEQFDIVVKNRSSRQINLAVFVDGVNTLGKRRELPDADCQIWWMKRKASGTFRGFYTKDGAGDVVEPFRIVPVEDAVAVRQGFTDRLGLITVVVFDYGQPDRARFIRRRHQSYQITRNWDAGPREWKYKEDWFRWPGIPTAEMPSGPRGGVGTDAKEDVEIIRRRTQRGPILVAMTIRYATRSEIAEMINKLEA